MTITKEGIAELRALADAATPIPGAPGYLIDAAGRAYSTESNWRGYGARQLAAHPNGHGYLRVRIRLANGQRKNAMVHSLVAAAFLPPRPSSQHEVRHLDGNRANNASANLAWGTRRENAADRERHQRTARGERNGFAKLTSDSVRRIRGMLEAGLSQRLIAKRVGISQRVVCNINRGKTWRHVQ